MKKKIPIAVVVLVITLCLSTAMAFELGFNFGFGGSNRVKWIDLLPVLSGWSPSSKAFGNVSTGVVKRQSFTITNSGNTYAEDVTVAVTGSAPFALYSTQTFGNISSGRTLTAKVRFAPAVQGTYSGHLTYSAPNITAVSAALSGTGVIAEPACISGTVTGGVNIVSYSALGTGNIGAAITKGSQFQVSANGNLYSVLVNRTSSESVNITCRAATSLNFTTYIAEGTLTSATSGITEIIMATHPNLATGTQYYFACMANSTTAISNTSDSIPGGDRISGTAWESTFQGTGDIKYGVKLCQ